MPVKRGNTILIPSGPNPGQMHLFVVCTDPCANGKVVLAGLTEWKSAKCDGTAKLSVGDHPFITKESYIAYHFARLEYVIGIETGINKGILVPRADMQEPHLTRIIEGLMNSPHTPRRIKKYLDGG